MRLSYLKRRALGCAALLFWSCLGFADTRTELAMGYKGLSYAAPIPGSYELPPIQAAADGQVLNEQGQALALHDVLRGKNSLLAFVYSNCSDVNGCPLAAHVFYQLKVAMQDDPALAEGLQLVSLSFDPERDTPEVMRLYGRNFQYAGEAGDWHFLTTSSESALTPLLQGYQQERQRQISVTAEHDTEYGHLLRVFLVDENLQVRNIYGVSFLHPELLISDVRTLLLESGSVLANNTLGVASGTSSERLQRIESPPLGLPALEVRHTEAEITLGRRLFFDRRLSLNGTFSCAMCHLPTQGFSSNELATSVGLEGRSVRRNAPSLFNIAYAERLFHDGRDTLLEEQIWSPLLAHNEMANPSVGFVMDTLRGLPVYREAFQQAYGEPPNVSNLGSALAAYQRTLNSADSPFDRWHYGGDEGSVSDAVKRGFALFTGKANCDTCHRVGAESALFSDWQLHNTGTGYFNSMGAQPKTQLVQAAPGVFIEVDMDIINQVAEPVPADLGRYEITQDPADRWKYRTPSLRNVALSAPYMHDGSMQTLRDVIDFYADGGVVNENLSPLIKPLELNEQERQDIQSFLSSLTGSDVDGIVADALSAPVGDPGGDGEEGAQWGVSSEYKP
ncbi:MAG: cytochrome c peroxidase [Granulosicoccaceae bacterium]